jgi:hypothetical protein
MPWYVNLHTEPGRIDWTTAGVATAISNRLELSYGHEAIAIEGLENVHKNNVGAKALLLPENSFGLKFLPAVAVGVTISNLDFWDSTFRTRIQTRPRSSLNIVVSALLTVLIWHLSTVMTVLAPIRILVPSSHVSTSPAFSPVLTTSPAFTLTRSASGVNACSPRGFT